MSDCQHELAERETACVDGHCPICQAIDLRHLRAEVAALRKEADSRRANARDSGVELRILQGRYQRMLEWAAQLKAYEPPPPIIVSADSPMVAALAAKPANSAVPGK